MKYKEYILKVKTTSEGFHQLDKYLWESEIIKDYQLHQENPIDSTYGKCGETEEIELCPKCGAESYGNCPCKPKEDKCGESGIDESIDVRSEEDAIYAFNKFIKKWCGKWYPHLIDDDENDGQFMREKIMTLGQPKEEKIEKIKPGDICHTIEEKDWYHDIYVLSSKINELVNAFNKLNKD